MMDVRIYTLIHKELTGELTPSETNELTKLRSHSSYTAVANDLSLIWNASKEYYPTQDWNKASAKEALMSRIKADKLAVATPKSTNTLYKYMALAILVLGVCGLTYYMMLPSDVTVEAPMPLEEIEFASLEDDTRLWTQPGSVVEVTSYSATERNVSLRGEAIFDVAKDPNRPFTIDMGNDVQVQVLGTSFKATSAHDGRSGSVSVREGRVRLYSKANSEVELILEAGETGTLNPVDLNSSKTITSEPIVLEGTTQLALMNISLEDAFAKMSKHYGVDFDINSGNLSCSFNNTLVSSATLKELFEGIQGKYPNVVIEAGSRSSYIVSGSCK